MHSVSLLAFTYGIRPNFATRWKANHITNACPKFGGPLPYGLGAQRLLIW